MPKLPLSTYRFIAAIAQRRVLGVAAHRLQHQPAPLALLARGRPYLHADLIAALSSRTWETMNTDGSTLS